MSSRDNVQAADDRTIHLRKKPKKGEMKRIQGTAPGIYSVPELVCDAWEWVPGEPSGGLGLQLFL